GPVRRHGRCRSGRGCHHLGGDAGRGRGPARRVPSRRRQRRRGRGTARPPRGIRGLVEDPAQRRVPSRPPRLLPARPAGPGRPARRAGAARMGGDAQGGGVRDMSAEPARAQPAGAEPASTGPTPSPSLLWGPLTRFGLVVAIVSAAIDQAAKFWLLFVVDLPGRGIVTLTPFL